MPRLGPFPAMKLGQQPPMVGNVKQRTWKLNGSDSYTGPSYAERRCAGDVIPVSGVVKPVRRCGVMVGNRGEWKR